MLQTGSYFSSHACGFLLHPRDRTDEIRQHNSILLERLEKIHERIPKQFDVSHHIPEVLNAPRASNANARRRKEQEIERENRKMLARINKTKGMFNNKQLVIDAEKHEYLSGQISKVDRRRKVKQMCASMHNKTVLKAAEASVHCSPHWQEDYSTLELPKHYSSSSSLDSLSPKMRFHGDSGSSNQQQLHKLPLVNRAPVTEKYHVTGFHK